MYKCTFEVHISECVSCPFIPEEGPPPTTFRITISKIHYSEGGPLIQGEIHVSEGS